MKSIQLRTLQSALAVIAICVAQPASAQTNPDGTPDTGDAHDGQKLISLESPQAIAKRLQW